MSAIVDDPDAPLAWSSPEECAYCAGRIRAGAAFCRHCGRHVLTGMVLPLAGGATKRPAGTDLSVGPGPRRFGLGRLLLIAAASVLGGALGARRAIRTRARSGDVS